APIRRNAARGTPHAADYTSCDNGSPGYSMSSWVRSSPRTRRERLRAFARILLLAMVVVLAACGKSEAPPAAAKPPEKPVAAAAQKPAGFALEDMKSEMHEGALAIALTFTQNLAGSQAFDTMLHVTGPKGEAVSGSWALDENGRVLRFPFVE